MLSPFLSAAVAEAVAEIEETAPLHALVDRFARLSTQYELEGRLGVSGACDVVCIELQGIIEMIQEINSQVA